MSQVKISFITAGYCTHPEKVVYQQGHWKNRVFPASVAVIEHPKEGIVLFDTGYSERFLKATQRFPNILYRWLTPVYLDEGRTALAQLEKVGIQDRDVRHVILSHFHADHVGGVSDFSQAKYVYQSESYEEVKSLSTFSALRKAFLPALLPNDFLERSQPVPGRQFSAAPPELKAFQGAHDMFGDGSVWLVPLPGHTEGHLGLFVRADTGDYLLAGDASYVRENFVQDSPSSFITRLIFSDFDEYKRTLHKLNHFHLLNPKTHVVPCHCANTLARLPTLEASHVALHP